MVGEIKTLEERKNKLIKLGNSQGYVTYEQLANELKGLEIDSDSLDDLYNALTEDITKRIEEDKPSDIPSRIISSFYIGAIFCTVIEWLRDKGKYTKEDIIKYLSKLINDNLK